MSQEHYSMFVEDEPMLEEDFFAREDDETTSDEDDILFGEGNPRSVPGVRTKEQEISLSLGTCSWKLKAGQR